MCVGGTQGCVGGKQRCALGEHRCVCWGNLDVLGGFRLTTGGPGLVKKVALNPPLPYPRDPRFFSGFPVYGQG